MKKLPHRPWMRLGALGTSSYSQSIYRSILHVHKMTTFVKRERQGVQSASLSIARSRNIVFSPGEVLSEQERKKKKKRDRGPTSLEVRQDRERLGQRDEMEVFG